MIARVVCSKSNELLPVNKAYILRYEYNAKVKDGDIDPLNKF